MAERRTWRAILWPSVRALGGLQQLLRIDFDGECADVPPVCDVDVLTCLIRAHHLIVLSDYAKGCLGDLQAVIRIARCLRRPVLVDPKGHDFSRYARATIITPNCAELARIVGAWHSEEELAKFAQALHRSLQVRVLLLTRSTDGMTWFDESGARHCPVQAREVFDVCGAGDTVITVLASGVRCETAVAFANRAARIVVGKLGTAATDYDELFVGDQGSASL